MFFSTLFTLFGLGALCWIMFNLAVYALPFAIGLTSGMYLHETGQGVFLSIIAGLFIGGFVTALGEFAFDRIRWAPLKLAIGLIYAVPAGIAGFHAAKGLAEFGSAGAVTITFLSWLGALIIGGDRLGASVGLVRDQRHVRPASAKILRRTLNAL